MPVIFSVRAIENILGKQDPTQGNVNGLALAGKQVWLIDPDGNPADPAQRSLVDAARYKDYLAKGFRDPAVYEKRVDPAVLAERQDAILEARRTEPSAQLEGGTPTKATIGDPKSAQLEGGKPVKAREFPPVVVPTKD